MPAAAISCRKMIDMLKCKFSGFNILGTNCCLFSGIASEDYNVKKRVAHKTISAVNTANGFSGNEKILNSGFSVVRNIYTAVLIVKSRIHKNRLAPNINAVFSEHAKHCRNSAFNSSLSVFSSIIGVSSQTPTPEAV